LLTRLKFVSETFEEPSAATGAAEIQFALSASDILCEMRRDVDDRTGVRIIIRIVPGEIQKSVHPVVRPCTAIAPLE
jgi:hypothetical protein